MEVLFLIIGILLVWYWFDGARAREQAVLAARRACERNGQQLLDETVLLERLRLRRGRDGRLRLRREYSFEFGSDSAVRHCGSLALFGGRVVDLQLSLPEGTLYDAN